jgi:cysteine desulfuration protein SufE
MTSFWNNFPSSEQIELEFQRLKTWPKQMQYLIALSQKLPQATPDLVQDQNKIKGCEVDSWMQVQSAEIVFWTASKITAGLLVVALVPTSSQDSATFEMKLWLEKLGLGRFLSESRQAGLRGVEAHFQKIRATC